MAQARTLQPISVTATNVGDGTTVELAWSVLDLKGVKAFQVERYDKGRRRWVPYDNFHGILTASPTDPLGAPPRRVSVRVPSPGQHTFRVRTLAKDGSTSEWVSATCEVYVAAGYLADTGASYVLNAKGDSLRVESASPGAVRVLPGTAFILGIRRSITEPVVLVLPATSNWQGLVAIDQEGVLSVVEGRTTPQNSLRLANLTLDASGSLTIEDTRALWAPTPVAVTASTTPPLTITVTWTPYSELNLEGFILYRGLSPTELKPYAELSKIDGTYIDADVQPRVDYYYAVAAFDPVGQTSAPSTPLSAHAGDDVPPAAPVNLRSSYKAIDRFNITVILEWDRNTEPDMSHYEVWAQTPFTGGNFVLVGTVVQVPEGSIPRFEDPGAANGEVRRYYVVAVDAGGLKSLPSSILDVTVGDTVPPAAPTWATPAYQTGGAWGEAWYELYWNPVTQNADGSACDDLAGYNLYADEGLDASGQPILRYLQTIPADQTTLRIEGIMAGTTISVRLTAFDRLGNASSPSELLTFQAGDALPPAPPQNLAATLLFADGVPKVRLSWDPPTTNADGTPLTDLGGFSVLRLSGVGTPDVPVAAIADPTQVSYEDATVQRFKTYSYAVVAKDRDGNVSAPSNVVTLTIDDTTPPPAPTWSSLTTSWSGTTVTNHLAWSLSDPDGDLQETWIFVNDSAIPIVVPKETTTYDHVGVENGHVYTYTLKAVDRLGNVSPGATNSIVAGDLTAPAQVTGLAAQGTGTFESPAITLSWTAVTQTNEDSPRTLGSPGVVSLGGYHIYRSYTGAAYQRIATVDAATTSYTDTGLINKRPYHYKVSAFSHLGVEGPLSDPASAPAGDTTPPSPPEVTYTASFDPRTPAEAALTFTLTQPSGTEPAAAYRGEVAPSAAGPYTRFAEGPSPLVYQAPVGLASHYRFYALDAAGNVSDATSLSITPANTTPPPDVTSVVASHTLGADQRFTVTLTWDSYTLPDPAVFQAYRVLQDQASPALVGVVRAYQDRRFTVFGLAPGTHTFAVVCDDVWGNSSTPQWIVVTLADTTTPNSPASVSTESLPLLIAVSWPAVTTNTDGSPVVDLLHYRIQAIDRLPPGEAVLKEWTTAALSVTHSTTPAEGPFFYRVRAEDRHGNVSAWTYTAAPAQSQPVDSGSFDTTPPAPPTMGFATVGLDEATADGTRDFWATITWTPSSDPTAVAQRVYLGRDGRFQPVATLSASQDSYTFHNLLPDTAYQAYVTAIDGSGNESATPAPLPFTTAKDTAATSPPSNLSVTVGKGLLGVRWDPPADKDIAYFEAEYAEAPDKNNPVFGGYVPVYKGKAAFFIHQPLDHQKAYKYRIRSVDSTDNPSIWVETSPASPDQQGSADIAAGAILAQHVQAETFEGNVIKARTLTGDRLAAGTITADEIAAGAVQAQHLQVTLGARNYLKNSAFHLAGRGDAPPSWQTDLSSWTLEEPPSLPLPQAQAARLPAGYAIWQDLIEPGLSGKPVILSAYVRVQLGATVSLQLLDATDPNSPTLLHEQTLAADSDWVRLSFISPYVLPDPAPPLRVRVLAGGDPDGYVHVTGLKLEASEKLTEWVPADGEAYSGTREAEISADGLRVVGGKLLVSTAPHPAQATSQVQITGEGILAGTYQSGQWQKGVKIHPDGILVSGGMFTLTTQDSPTGQTVGIRLDGSGLRAWSDGTESFALSTDGSLTLTRAFVLQTSPSAGDTRITLDQYGLKAFRSGVERFALDLTAVNPNPLVRLSGDFEIRSVDTPNTLTLSNSAFTLQTAAGTAFAVRANPGTGQAAVEMAGDFRILGSLTGSGTLTLESTGLTLRDANGSTAVFLGLEGGSTNRPVLRLDGQYAQFSITSQAGGVTIGPSGISGTGFHLGDDGFAIGAGAVSITNAGITVSGSGSGIAVGDPVVVQITPAGIDVRYDGGIRLSSGSITFGASDPPSTAIDASGIHADAIRTGTLTVAPSNGAAQIVVKGGPGGSQTKVAITPDGLTLYGGALTMYEGDTTSSPVLIENGRILASALQIGIGGANLLRNGRGDLGSQGWTVSQGALQLVVPAPVDQPTDPKPATDQALQWSPSVQGATCSQTLSGTFVSGDKIAFSGWLRVTNGTPSDFVVEILNVRDATEGSEPLVVPITATWQFYKARGVCTGAGQPVFRILHLGSSLHAVAFTDLVIARGDIPAESFTPHPTEIANEGRSVTIGPSGITVLNGALDIRTAADSVRIDSSGISGPNFNLTASGLAIGFTDGSTSTVKLGASPQLADMPSDAGLHMTRVVSGTLKGYLSLTPSSGLVVKSLDDAVPVFSLQSASGHSRIEPGRIRMEDPVSPSTRYVEITPADGLKIAGGKFKLSSGSLPGGTGGSVEIAFPSSTPGAEGVVVKSADGSVEAVLGRFYLDSSGNLSQSGVPYRGLYLNGDQNSRFYIRSAYVPGLSQSGAQLKIDAGAIEMSEGSDYVRITPRGIFFANSDSTSPPHVAGYAANIELGKDSPEAIVPLNGAYPRERLKVLVIPQSMQTYDASKPDKHQGLAFWHDFPAEEGDTPSHVIVKAASRRPGQLRVADLSGKPTSVTTPDGRITGYLPSANGVVVPSVVEVAGVARLYAAGGSGYPRGQVWIQYRPAYSSTWKNLAYARLDGRLSGTYTAAASGSAPVQRSDVYMRVYYDLIDERWAIFRFVGGYITCSIEGFYGYDFTNDQLPSSVTVTVIVFAN